MRLRSLLAAAIPLALASCNLNTVGETGPLIDCSTLASSLAASASTLTTTASGLQYRDQTIGTGATFTTGSQVSVRYAGCITTGQRFDSNEAPAGVFSFTLGSGLVIAGWDEGLVGMKVGGRRQLVIPPSLGYGAVQNGPIPPNSTLVFTIDAISTP
jgi:FKBP-type peptidyl-prolyl cis-trans isomerase